MLHSKNIWPNRTWNGMIDIYLDSHIFRFILRDILSVGLYTNGLKYLGLEFNWI